MRPASLFILILSLFVSAVSAFGQRDENRDARFKTLEIEEQGMVSFIANEGQWEKQIKYLAHIPGGSMFLEQGQITYKFCDMNDFHDRFYHSRGSGSVESLDCHAFKVKFRNSNKNLKIEPKDKAASYHNYFIGKNPDNWAGGVSLYGTVRYQEMYPGIDLQVYGKHLGIKYDFILKPGANADEIAMDYEGIDKLEIVNGALRIQTSVNEIIEEKPYAYQVINGRRSKVDCNFVLEENSIRFHFPNSYDKSIPLVIDPTLIFSTFTGSTADNFGYTATYDNQGNLYAGGVAFGAGIYPTTVGAFQDTFQGGGAQGLFGPIDISITKFNPTGTAIVYSTYLGGSANEQPHSMIVNDNGELCIYARTWSNNFPVTATAYDTTQNGDADIAVTVLNATGTGLVGSTYVGGSDDEAINITTAFGQNSLKYNYGDDARGEIMLDDQSNIYVTSCTQSTNFPVSPGALQTTNAGMQDAVVFKMNSNLTSMVWSTYLGGSNQDAGYSLKVDKNYEVYVAGGTASTNFPTKVGALQFASGGGIDGYIAHINASGNSINMATYLGTNGYDQTYFLELDAPGDVYVFGQTTGTWPVTSGVYSNANGKQFIQKISPGLNATFYSTIFGSGGNLVNIAPSAFLVDVCGYIYISGWGGGTNFQPVTGNTNGLAVTSNAYQSTTDGSDFYLMVLQPDAVALEYATFFGGNVSNEHVDGGTSRFNKDLEVYQAACAGCGGNSDFPSTPGVVSDSNYSSNCNLGAFKMQFDVKTIEAKFIAGTSIGCAPFPVTFNNQSTGGVNFLWDFGDGSTDTSKNPTHVYTVADTYKVVLQILDSASCNVYDTVQHTVITLEQPAAAASGDTIVCNGSSVPLNASGGGTYAWSPPAGLSATNISNPQASPSVTTIYQVVVTAPGGCTDTANVLVQVTTFKAEAGPPANFCFGTGGTQLLGSSVGGIGPYYYTWWCDSTSTWCGLDSVFDNDPIANPDTTTKYYLQVTDFNGCLSLVDSTIVTVKKLPIADAGPDIFVCHAPGPGGIIKGTVTNPLEAPGPYIYQWTPSVGLNDSTILTPYARPDTTTIYTLIISSSGNGCTSHPTTTDTLSSVVVNVKPLPVADAGPDMHICPTDSTQLQGKGFSAGPLYHHQWSPQTGLSDSSAATPWASPPFTFNYFLTVWSNGCPSYADTVIVNVHVTPTADAGPDREICLGDSTFLDAQASGDSTSTSYTYLWSPPLGLNNPMLEDPNASPDSSQIYQVVASSIWGCASPPDFAEVHLKPTPIAEAGDNIVICDEDSVQLHASYFYTTTDSADTSQIFYTWTPGSGISDSIQQNPWAYPTATSTYYLKVQYNSCITNDSVLVSIFPELKAGAFADTSTICGGDSVQLYTSGGVGNPAYEWIPPQGLSDPTSGNPMASPNDSVVYLMVMHEGGCTDTIPVPVNVIPRPEISAIHSTNEGCIPLEISFLENSAHAQAWRWDFGDGSVISNLQNPSHTYHSPGKYEVRLTGRGLGDCSESALITKVIVHDTARADFSTNPDWPATVTLPNSIVEFRNLSSNATSWHWDFGDGKSTGAEDPIHRFRNPGEFFVTLTAFSAEGCMSKVRKGPILVLAPDLSIPNIFSPNGDGNNDEFVAIYSGNQPFRLLVFDRWGVRHYTTNNKMAGWNGRSEEGVELQEGVYYYELEVGDDVYSGAVTLIR